MLGSMIGISLFRRYILLKQEESMRRQVLMMPFDVASEVDGEISVMCHDDMTAIRDEVSIKQLLL